MSSIAPGHLPLHVQYVWDADVPWQLLLLFEVGCGLCEPQHRLVDVVGCYGIQLGACLSKSTSDQLLKAGILQPHQLFTLQALVEPCSGLPCSRSSLGNGMNQVIGGDSLERACLHFYGVSLQQLQAGRQQRCHSVLDLVHYLGLVHML